MNNWQFGQQKNIMGQGAPANPLRQGIPANPHPQRGFNNQAGGQKQYSVNPIYPLPDPTLVGSLQGVTPINPSIPTPVDNQLIDPVPSINSILPDQNTTYTQHSASPINSPVTPIRGMSKEMGSIYAQNRERSNLAWDSGSYSSWINSVMMP